MKTVALCTDKDGGLTFFGKRQSTDKEVRKRLLEMASPLYVDEYTATQFIEDNDTSNLKIDNNWRDIPEAFVFIEKDDIPDDANRIIIFNWHRKYAADRKLNFDFKGWKKVKKEDFAGYAHEKITMEVYEKR